MPVDLLPFYADVRVAIETDPWNAPLPDPKRPGNMRVRYFGPTQRGAHLVYFVLEEQRSVVLVQLHWID
ncbi:hypothetical protein [Tenggerimyces flavus]|uniref:Uncharacterized protein n=1 Tax=Tenggerimyces flavus TaxID=1708749 RepID=A0ABV7Y5M3_9ACTN|nr:hypothetical protein [Tenggerimyces flavus]MBM7790576.1 hypothetical protein [Tenggerimyces flavus]